MAEPFPDKKPGDQLSAEHVNNLNRAGRWVRDRAGSSFLSMAGGHPLAPSPHNQRIVIVVGIQIEEESDHSSSSSSSDSASSASSASSGSFSSSEGSDGWDCEGASYQVRMRYYDTDDNEWKTNADDESFCMDASEFGDPFSVGDVLVAWWDPQRGAFVPGNVSGINDSTGVSNATKFARVTNGLNRTTALNPAFLQTSLGVYTEAITVDRTYFSGYAFPNEIVEVRREPTGWFAYGRGHTKIKGVLKTDLESRGTALVWVSTLTITSSDGSSDGFYDTFTSSVRVMEAVGIPDGVFVAGTEITADWHDQGRMFLVDVTSACPDTVSSQSGSTSSLSVSSRSSSSRSSSSQSSSASVSDVSTQSSQSGSTSSASSDSSVTPCDVSAITNLTWSMSGVVSASCSALCGVFNGSWAASGVAGGTWIGSLTGSACDGPIVCNVDWNLTTFNKVTMKFISGSVEYARYVGNCVSVLGDVFVLQVPDGGQCDEWPVNITVTGT